jgi:hypothetical protein
VQLGHKCPLVGAVGGEMQQVESPAAAHTRARFPAGPPVGAAHGELAFVLGVLDVVSARVLQHLEGQDNKHTLICRRSAAAFATASPAHRGFTIMIIGIDMGWC